VSEEYKARIRNSLSGVFYKRNYLGIWCLAEGAIFDFFDTDVHVVDKPPFAADYWVAGIDYGVSNAFACVLVGISTGKHTGAGKCMWVEKEYTWDCKRTGRQKINSEFADDVQEMLEPYGVTQIYIDPSALSMKLELQRRGMGVISANNDVNYGIETMTAQMANGNLFVCAECKNLIREIQGYVWDTKKSSQGEDVPVKKGDHNVDALRYVMATHKVVSYNPYKNKPNDQWKNRFEPYSRR
jgi:PBSX family phage terminase large subunit